MAELTSGIGRLKELIEGDDDMTIHKAANYIQEAAINIEDLIPYAQYNHPPEEGYGRKMVVEGKGYEIMVMSWNPGDFSAIHNHGNTTWGAVQVFGHVMHHTFKEKYNSFSLISKEILPYGTIITVNNLIIHQMGNVTSNPYLTLHVYGADNFKGGVTDDSRIYEVETGLIKHTSGGAFINLPDQEVYNLEKMPEVDYQTLVHQTSILIPYYQRFKEDKITHKMNLLIEKLMDDKLHNIDQ